MRKSLSQETLYFVYTSSRLRKILLCGFNIIRDVVFDVRKIFSFAENSGRFIILRDLYLVQRSVDFVKIFSVTESGG